MSVISADALGQIILKAYKNFPQFFTGNYTLADVFWVIRYNGTILSVIANTTGLDGNKIQQTVGLYLRVTGYWKPTAEAPTTSNTTNVPYSPCIPEITNGSLTIIAVFFAFIILLVLSFLNTRKREAKLCGKTIKRPGLCIPVNLVDSYENRFAFACAFGATTTKCLGILLIGDFSEIFPKETIEEIETYPSYTAIIWKMLAMVVIGVAYYPLFACLATDFKITGFVIGFLYSALWILFETAQFIQCPSYKSIVFPGDGFAFEFPVFVCLLYLWLKYFLLLVQAIRTRCRLDACPKDEENEWMTFYKYRYVVKLLEPIPKEHRDQVGSTSLKRKVQQQLYKWKPEFKYSTRVICTYLVSFIGIYQILLLFTMLGGVALRFRDRVVENSLINVNTLREMLMIAAVSIFVAVGITGIYSIILVANMLSWYRGHLLRLQRGEKDFLPVQIFTRNPSGITAATLKYSGYQVAYLCWGMTITVLTLTVIAFVVGQQIIMPIVDGNLDSFVWLKLKDLWPAVALSLVFFWFQLLMAKYAFLVDKDSTLALDNRRLFHVCTFFLFFFNIFLGVISCLKRILMGAVLGVMFLGRTQKSVISRDFELMDPGFNAYVGYLLLEHTHANPVLVTFCRLLIKTLNDRNIPQKGKTCDEGNHMVHHNPPSNNQVSIELNNTSRENMCRRVRNRWQLLLTLHNNPSLKEHRRSDLFIQKSPFAAFGIMIQRGMMQYSGEEEDVQESGAEDVKL